jgi:hypothetical protein
MSGNGLWEIIAMQPDTAQDDRKLEELIVYIAQKCCEHERFGSIKLNKILFFSDFLSFQIRGKSITGSEYQKLERGPAPRKMKPILNRLEANESIVVWPKPVIVHGRQCIQKRPAARRNPDLAIFSGDEIEMVNSVIYSLKDDTADQVSQMSHAIGWDLAAMNETIPYETTFWGWGSDNLSKSDLEFGNNLLNSLR